MSQEDLAKSLNVTQQTINNYENNKREPKQDMLCKIADYFNVDLEWLIRGNKLPIPDDRKYEDLAKITLEEEFAKKGLSREAQREALEYALRIVEESRKRYNNPIK